MIGKWFSKKEKTLPISTEDTAIVTAEKETVIEKKKTSSSMNLSIFGLREHIKKNPYLIFTGFVDRKGREVYNGDKVYILRESWGSKDMYLNPYVGFITLQEGEFRVTNLRHMETGQPLENEPAKNHIKLSMLRDKVNSEYVMGVGRVHTYSNNLWYLSKDKGDIL